MILNEKLFECFNPDDEANDMLDLEADKKEVELQEDFSPSFPKWLTNAIKRDNVGRYLSQQGIDLNKAEFIESDPPVNGWDPKAKDPNLIKVFYLKTENDRYPSYQLYIPGYYGDVKQFDLSGNYRGVQLKTYSMKQLANHAEAFGYIDISDSKNTNFKLRKERRDVQAGDINLKRDSNKQYSKRDIVSYPKDERGFTDWRNPILGDLKWVTNKGYDKSGYKINKDKYKEILKKLKAENYQAAIEETLNKLEDYRSRLINVLSSMNLKDSKDLSAVNLTSDYLYRMIESYTDVVKALERIESKNDLSEEDKKSAINWEVKYFLNKFTEWEEDFKRYLVKIEPKTECLGESFVAAEDIAKYQEYVDYDMKTYGEISDVTNRKLKESGLEVVKDDHGDYVVTVKEKDGKVEGVHPEILKESEESNVGLLTDEFIEIALEIGMTTNKDFERFKAEELGGEKPTAENLLTAIKRYKQELLDAGVNLKDLKEGVMSEIDLEIKNAGGKEEYQKELEKEVSKLERWITFLTKEAPKQVAAKISNFDTQEEVDEALDKAYEDLAEKKARLKFIQG